MKRYNRTTMEVPYLLTRIASTPPAPHCGLADVDRPATHSKAKIVEMELLPMLREDSANRE